MQRQLTKNTLLDVAYVGNHGLHLEGFLNANQRVLPTLGTTSVQRAYANWPSDITEALNEFYSNYNALQVRYEQRFVAGLTLLNSFTWEHSLDNASASLEGNTPSPQNGLNPSADYAQSDYNLPLANVTSLVYELPFGRSRRFLSGANGLLDSIIGGWQISAINTAQAGTPFNLTYSPNATQQVSPQISATYRGANEYRPDVVAGQKITQGVKQPRSQHRLRELHQLRRLRDPARSRMQPATSSAPSAMPRAIQAARLRSTRPTSISTRRFDTPIENLKIEFRAEAYNVFNHTNFYLPGNISGSQGTTTTTASTGGTVPVSAISGSPTGGGQITSTFEPRIFQFALKVIY